MPPTATALIVFARAPVLGTVKTRLAAGIGAPRALAVYRALTELVLHAVQGAASRVVVCYAPHGAGQAMRAWLGAQVEYAAQAAGDLGQRLLAAIVSESRLGASAIVVIGTDCPAVTSDIVRQAFAALKHADVVIGPAIDGGYYLIGMREPHAELFREIPWSSAQTLTATMERASSSGLRVAVLEAFRDIDTVNDLRAYDAEGFSPSTPAPRAPTREPSSPAGE
jgi:rSAM/selenodomain-associated transferase 1